MLNLLTYNNVHMHIFSNDFNSKVVVLVIKKNEQKINYKGLQNIPYF